MKNIIVKISLSHCSTMVTGILLFFLTFFLMVGTSYGQVYSSIKIYPEHVGVFTADGKQQFIAMGIKANGAKVNITSLVDWKSSNTSIVTIDQKGLAEIVKGKTYGQVKISCVYPKKKNNISGILSILLKKYIPPPPPPEEPDYFLPGILLLLRN